MRSSFRKIGLAVLAIAILLCLVCMCFVFGIAGAGLEALKGHDVEFLRVNAYVSDNPALSTNPALAAYVLDAYRKYAGVPPPAAHDLRYAFRPYTLVAKFELSKADLVRFSRGKRKDADSVAGLYRNLDYEGDHIVFPFFSQLAWWPIPPDEVAQYEEYTGKCWYASEWFEAHDEYSLLVNRRTCVVYLVAFPSD